MDRRFGAELNRTDYTTKELKKIYDAYVAKDGFVGLMTKSTPLAVQEYVYRGMTRPFTRFITDISILLSRRGYKNLAKNLKKMINTIRKSMLKNGCYVGSGDYYNNKGKPNAK
jgi:hypothetical protein